MERILGIDPGSRITGYGVIESARGRLRFVSCGVIRTTPRSPFAHRLNEIFDGINEVVQLHGPEIAAVEGCPPIVISSWKAQEAILQAMESMGLPNRPILLYAREGRGG